MVYRRGRRGCGRVASLSAAARRRPVNRSWGCSRVIDGLRNAAAPPRQAARPCEKQAFLSAQTAVKLLWGVSAGAGPVASQVGGASALVFAYQ